MNEDEVSKDRVKILDIFTQMFDGADEHGIYPTSTAYIQLEHYIQQERNLAIGCTHAACCIELDKGNDPRLIECPALFNSINKALEEN